MRFSNHAFKVECCRDERFVKARRVNPKNFFAELKRRNARKGERFIKFLNGRGVVFICAEFEKNLPNLARRIGTR